MKLRLLERFDELGWATTCRCDILAQWTGLNENWRSQAEMAALSQERDADVGWREK